MNQPAAIIFAALILGSLPGGLTVTGYAQAPDGADARAGRPVLEVATVKRNKSVDSPQNSRVLPGGRIELTNMPLRTLIRIAYGSTGSQIVGGPGWIASDGYDIVAKVSGDVASEAGGAQPRQMMAILKSLLEDRFQLKVHPETRETQTYTLVVANRDGKLGPRLKDSHADCSPNATTRCGIRGGNGDISYTGLAMPQIATSIAGYPAVRAPVIDRTGLTGRYDLHLEFNEDAGPNVFTALIEQAGLKLQPEKGQAEFIVVDRAERPVED
jgi:uncharacterized protein (TIGR03435 family)